MPEGSESVAPQENTPLISLVFAYYENPRMLEYQWKTIASYSADVKKRIEIIVVDDGSPNHPAASVPMPHGLPSLAIYRIDRDIPWNQDAARNIGAHESQSRWLILTDIDHLVPEATLSRLFALDKEDSVIYTFSRVKVHTGEQREPHPNSYFMAKHLYWQIGGHDEDYAGIYGKDFLFRRRALSVHREEHLADLCIVRVGSETVADAGTSTISRKNTAMKTLRGYILQLLKAMRLWRGVQTLTQSYRRVV